MLKRLFILFVTAQLLINGISASAHMADSDHASHNIPHLHLDKDNDNSWMAPSRFSWNESIEQETKPNDNQSSEHSSEHHFHIHLHAYLVSNETYNIEQVPDEQPVGYNFPISSLSYSPPVPPPTV